MLFKEGNITISERHIKEKEKWVNLIKTMFEDMNRENERLGAGRTAEAVLTDNEACLKVVNKARVRKERIPITNQVHQEIEYLEKLNDEEFLKRAGINQQIAPLPIMSTEENGYGFLLMEKISGNSLQDILDKKNTDFDSTKVSWEKFFEKLEEIVNKLNNARLFHRDLHAGNIMINEDHNPILIDFGSSYESFYSEDDPYKEEGVTGITVYKQDTTFLQEIKKNFIY